LVKQNSQNIQQETLDRKPKGTTNCQQQRQQQINLLNIVLFYANDWTMKILGKLNPLVQIPNMDCRVDVLCNARGISIASDQEDVVLWRTLWKSSNPLPLVGSFFCPIQKGKEGRAPLILDITLVFVEWWLLGGGALNWDRAVW
jgi:hypothetical protein